MLPVLFKGFQENYVQSPNNSSFLDDRKQKVVASPDSTTVISGDRHCQLNGRNNLTNARNKTKSNL